MTTLASNNPTQSDRSGAAPANGEPRYLGLQAGTWLKTGAIMGLFCLLFWPNLRRLWDKTNPFTGEPNWGHSPFIPLVGLYYLYINRERLRAARVVSAWEGLVIALVGILVFGYGIYPGQNDWFKDVGMVIALFGVVTLLCGWEVMKTAWFPIVFLFCALPWPGLVYSRVAGPLQQLAASVAVKVLHLTGVESGQFGTKIIMVGSKNVVRTLNVAEACAGLRSLMTFVSVAAMVAFLSTRPMWQKVIQVAAAVPIAILCNVMRVSGQGLLDRYVSPQLSESFAHQFVGLVMLIPAFFLILLVGWILQNIFIEEVDDKAALRVRSRAAANPVAADKPPMTPPPAAAALSVPAPARPAAAPRAAVLPPRPTGLAGTRPPRPAQVRAKPAPRPKSEEP